MMEISIVAAIAQNGVIGINNTLPWKLPADLKHFRDLTIDKPIVMGRKTYQSIGKPLPRRRNIIISKSLKFAPPQCEIYPSLNIALDHLKSCQEVMIIGGAALYKQAIPKAHKLYLTVVQHDFNGDTHFPKLQPELWCVLSKQDYPADEHNQFPYTFLILVQNND